MAWTNLTFAVGSILTSAKMTQLYDNITAFANQDTDSPVPGTAFITIPGQVDQDVVGNYQLTPGAVWKSSLTTSTASLAGSIPVSDYVNIDLHPYSFFPLIHAIDGAGVRASVFGHSIDAADPDSPGFSVYNPDAATPGSYDVDYRYISL